MPMIDPVLFGGKPSAEGPFADFLARPTGQDQEPVQVQDTRVSVDATLAGTRVAQEGAAVRAAAGTSDPGMWASAKAAAKLWDGAALLEAISMPDMPGTPGYSPEMLIRNIPFALTEDELNFMRKSRSADEGQYRLERVKSLRNAAEVAGEHGAVMFAVTAIDPPYLLAGGVGAGAKVLAGGSKLVGALSSGAVATGAAAGASTVTPKENSEYIMAVLGSMTAGAFASKGGKLVPKDAEYPEQALHAATTTPPPRLVTPEIAQATVDAAIGREATSWTAKVGGAIQWNIHKSLAGMGGAGKRIADLLVDNNSDLSINSVESVKRAVRVDLAQHQHVFEDSLRAAMAEDGFGMWQRIWNAPQAMRREAAIKKEVQLEMFRREQLQRQGRPITFDNVPPRIKAMADELDKAHARALRELKAAGVEGAEQIMERAGWHHRKWDAGKIEDLQSRLVRTGLTEEQAHKKVIGLVATAMRRANGWDFELSKDVASATVNRALRKGMFEDAAFGGVGADATKVIRDILKESGISGPRLERALDALTGKVDEAGKAPFLKRRIDMDYKSSIAVDGELVSVVDLLDSDLVTNVDRYLDQVSAQVALARKGLRSASDVDTLRQEFLAGLRAGEDRAQAAQLFDNTMAHLFGRPTGPDMGNFLRNTSAYGRMIALANSGLWQVTEVATAMSKYGALKVIKHGIKELPGFKDLLSAAAKDPRVSRSLKDILEGTSTQNLRLRPFIQKFEDNFEISPSNAMAVRLQQGQQLIPYFNAMKYVHGHQARVVAGIITDNLQQAATGSEKMAAMFEKYGIERPLMDKLKAAVKQHGMQVDAWDDGLWMQVRPAFAKMMDEAVLHQRLGDMPAFALMNPVGKFLFTYRSFTLAAHNKILAGGLARDGLASTSLLLTYQFPLAALAVQAQAGLNGRGELSTEDLASKAVGVMGGVGLGAEVWGVLSGQKQQWGAPGAIPIDRTIKLLGTTSDFVTGNAEGSKVINDSMQMVPILGLIPGAKATVHLEE